MRRFAFIISFALLPACISQAEARDRWYRYDRPWIAGPIYALPLCCRRTKPPPSIISDRERALGEVVRRKREHAQHLREFEALQAER